MTDEQRYTELLKELGQVIATQNRIITLNKCIACSLEAELATAEEFTKYIKSEFAAVFRKLARVRKKAKKGFNDQQYKITFGEYERNVVEAFINDKI